MLIKDNNKKVNVVSYIADINGVVFLCPKAKYI